MTITSIELYEAMKERIEKQLSELKVDKPVSQMTQFEFSRDLAYWEVKHILSYMEGYMTNELKLRG